ncbi:MAG: hypothetical protein ACPG77_14620 [Nannocystaceae bacterium]
MGESQVHGFGWSVSCPGRSAEQLAGEVVDLERTVSQAAEHFFPPKKGYALVRKQVDGPIDGIYIEVRRGDFEARVGLECFQRERSEQRAPTTAIAVRLFGRAGSSRLAEAERAGYQLTERLRRIGTGVGVGLLVMMFGYILTHPPHYSVDALTILSALLFVLVCLVTLTATSEAGSRLGERLAASSCARVQAEIETDDGFHSDVERWSVLSRGLVSQRSSFDGELRKQPFRTIRRTWAQPALPAAQPPGSS